MAHCCNQHSPDNALVAALEQLRAHEMRVTEPRKAMLTILTREHGPFSAEELHHKLKGRECDVVTVYRSLQAMEEIGVVRRCDFGDGTYRYEINHGEHHHHHIVCRVCRKVQVLEQCVVGKLERMAKEMGYENITHTLEMFGVCAKCSRKPVRS
jgi:Fur family transcriptional regulator, ferric uptake regulator